MNKQDNFSPLLTNEQNNRLFEIAEKFSTTGITNESPDYIYHRLLNVISPRTDELFSLLKKFENIPELRQG